MSEVDAAGALRHHVAMGTDNGFEIRRAGTADAAYEAEARSGSR